MVRISREKLIFLVNIEAVTFLTLITGLGSGCYPGTRTCLECRCLPREGRNPHPWFTRSLFIGWCWCLLCLCSNCEGVQKVSICFFQHLPWSGLLLPSRNFLEVSTKAVYIYWVTRSRRYINIHHIYFNSVKLILLWTFSKIYKSWFS